MDILGKFKVDDTSDVKEIKIRKVRTVKPQPIYIPITPIVEPTIKKYYYVSTDFILDFDD
jgi:hypothetical protein